MNCSYCNKTPLFKCYCNSSYLCQIHLDDHLQGSAEHTVERFKIASEDQRFCKLRSKALEKLKIIQNAKNEIDLKTSNLIKSIKREHRQALKNLDSISSYLISLQEQKTFFVSDLSHIESTIFGEITIQANSFDSITCEVSRIFSQDLVNFSKPDQEKSKK